MKRRDFLYFSCGSTVATSGALAGWNPALAEERPTEPGKAESAEGWPKIKASLLFAERDWSGSDGERLKAIKAALEGKTLPHQRTSATGDSELLSVLAVIPNAGQAAVYQPGDFAGLKQWLVKEELLAAEQAVRLQPTRFDGRYTATIDPDADSRVATKQVWNLQIDLMRSEDDAISARVNVKRSHSRPSPPDGPSLRGAAVDLRKAVSFFLPKDRVLAMTWYAHPDDATRAPTPDQRLVEPILAFETEPEPKPKADAPAADFRFPERLIELMVE